MLEPEIKKMIEDDIVKCEKQGIKGSHQLFKELRAKYTALDKDFMLGITVSSKAIVEDMDYTKELSQIKEKLKIYLIKGQIPIANEQSQQVNINNYGEINSKELVNINSHNKEKQINENGTKKVSWFKSWFKGAKK